LSLLLLTRFLFETGLVAASVCGLQLGSVFS
jgi:hypothetical protein